MAEDKRIENKFRKKDWNEIKANDSWIIFKVMAEFVEGFDKMAKIGPCVSIFGSARTKMIILIIKWQKTLLLN